jgi:hypothetical protein
MTQPIVWGGVDRRRGASARLAALTKDVARSHFYYLHAMSVRLDSFNYN